MDKSGQAHSRRIDGVAHAQRKTAPGAEGCAPVRPPFGFFLPGKDFCEKQPGGWPGGFAFWEEAGPTDIRSSDSPWGDGSLGSGLPVIRIVLCVRLLPTQRGRRPEAHEVREVPKFRRSIHGE